MFARLMQCLILAWFLPGAALAGERMVVSANPDYPPLSWAQGEEIVGAGVDLVRLAAREIGLEVEAPHVGPWARVQHYARTGRIDAVAGLYWTPEREEYLHFVRPAFLADPVAVFVAQGGAFPFAGLADLENRRGSTVWGNSQGPDFDRMAASARDFHYPKTVKAGLDMLLMGRTDYFVHGLYPVLAVAVTLGMRERIEALPRSVASEGLFLGVSRASSLAERLPALRAALDRLVRQGVPQRLMEQNLARWGRSVGNRSDRPD